MLSGLKASVQNELNAFFAHLANQADLLRCVSAQAFAKARQKFSHLAFAKLNERLLSLAGSVWEVPRWHGLRVVAADAAKLRLFLQDATGRQVREAIAFALYLPGWECTLCAELYAACVSERQMLFEHLPRLLPNDLLVLDRGYPARWLLAVLSQLNRHFCMRVDDLNFAGVRKFRRSGQTEAIVEIPAPEAADAAAYECDRLATRVRLIRVVTPNARVYVLMTSLLDANTYPSAGFADLYHARWRIEEAFKRLKHRLALEHVSGLSWLAASQDFGAKVLCDNLNALAVWETMQCSDIPAGYQVNRTYAFAQLKRCLSRWLWHGLPTLDELLNTLTLLAIHLVRFVKGASKPRLKRPKPHLHHAYKPTT